MLKCLKYLIIRIIINLTLTTRKLITNSLIQNIVAIVPHLLPL